MFDRFDGTRNAQSIFRGRTLGATESATESGVWNTELLSGLSFNEVTFYILMNHR